MGKAEGGAGGGAIIQSSLLDLFSGALETSSGDAE